LLAAGSRAEPFVAASLEVLLYTTIVSPGYFLARREPATGRDVRRARPPDDRRRDRGSVSEAARDVFEGSIRALPLQDQTRIVVTFGRRSEPPEPIPSSFAFPS
jgi:hypothetical protein